MQMIERFLRYSLETGRRIRVMMLGATGNVSTHNITVTRLEWDEGVFYARVGRGAERRYETAEVLSACYARGDAEMG